MPPTILGYVIQFTGLHQAGLALLSVAVFLNGDLKSAQRLIAEKVTFRELEMRYAESHLHRLSENTPQSVETSSLHLELIADMKRLNSLFCSSAYVVLETSDTGALSAEDIADITHSP